MNQDQRFVRMQICEKDFIPFSTPAFEFKPKGKFLFLKKWMWKKLHEWKQLDHHYDHTIQYRTVSIDRVRVADRLLTAYKYCFPYNMRPTRVYIGPEEFDELVGGFNNVRQILQFDVEMGFGYGKDGYHIFNIPITVLPHMKGVLIV